MYISNSYHLFGDKVNLREYPSTNSKVILNLKIGDPIFLLDKTTNILILNGKENIWYKVLVNSNKGYILDGFISDYYNSNNYESNSFVLMKKISNSYKITSYKIKYLINNIINEHLIDLEGDFDHEIKSIDYIKFNNNISFIRITSCEGYEVTGTYHIYLYLDRNKFNQVLKLQCEISDGDTVGGADSRSSVIYPNNSGGIKDCIIYNYNINVYNGNKLETNIKKKEKYKWYFNEKKFVKIE